MKKVFIALFALIVLALVYRLFFCYTIISIPIVSDAYEGGAKEQFDYSILNPFFINKLHSKYSDYVQNELKTQTDSERLKYFKSVSQSGFKIKNIKKVKDRVFVYVIHEINKTTIDGFFIYDEKKNDIIESEP
ncbi:MAG: hypothetical protein ACOCUT_04040 [bacterium]